MTRAEFRAGAAAAFLDVFHRTTHASVDNADRAMLGDAALDGGELC